MERFEELLKRWHAFGAAVPPRPAALRGRRAGGPDRPPAGQGIGATDRGRRGVVDAGSVREPLCRVEREAFPRASAALARQAPGAMPALPRKCRRHSHRTAAFRPPPPERPSFASVVPAPVLLRLVCSSSRRSRARCQDATHSTGGKATPETTQALDFVNIVMNSTVDLDGVADLADERTKRTRALMALS
jgi:hypothetical protein